MRLLALAIRNVAAARQPGKLLNIVARLLVCSLRLREIRFRTRHLRFGLTYASLGVEACLLDSDTRLLELLLQDRYLFLRTGNSRFSPLRRGPRLVLSRSRLLFVEHRYHVSRFHTIALAHSDFANAAGILCGHCRVIAFDSTAELNYVVWDRGLTDEKPPDQKAASNHNGKDDEKPNRSGKVFLRHFFWCEISAK